MTKTRITPPTLIIITLFLPLLITLQVSDTHISSTRSDQRTRICNYYSTTYTQTDKATSNAYISQYSYMNDQDVQNLLYNQDFTKFKSQAIVMVMPHMLALVTALCLAFPLCCCCIWPEKHPACKQCRKSEKQMYGKCQLKWTSYFSIIFYLIVLAGSIAGVVQGPQLIKYFNDMGCKLLAIGDDMLYGRLSPTVNNRFFVGLTPLGTDLTTFKTALNTIWSQKQNSLNAATNIRTKQNTFQLQINNTYSTYTDTVYSNAFSTNGDISGYTNINSIFKDTYFGPVTNPTSILGNLYRVSQNIFNQINNMLDPMIAAWGRLTTTNKPTVNNQLTTTISSISTLSLKLNSFVSNFGPFFDNQSLYDQIILLLKAFYGTFFALSLLGTLAAVILSCFSVVKVRFILYFTCGIIFCFSLFSFTCLIILSMIGPNLSQSCNYIDKQFSSGTTTSSFFTKLGADHFGSLLNNCMKDGNGWMMNQLSPTFNSTFADILLITQNTQLLNVMIPDYSTANLNAPFATASTTINKVLAAELLDINTTSALNFIDGLRLTTFSKVNCNNINVAADSWVPSYALYSCPGGKSSNPACLDLSNFATCPPGCYEIMQQMESASGDSNYSSNLQSRYGATCNYYTFIVNLQNFWNIPRKTAMNSVISSMASLGVSIADYDNTFKATQANITSYASMLQTNYNGQTNLTSGSFNGLDCRVIGESVQDFRDAVCIGFLNSVYYNITCLILISYGALFMSCCTICAGVRHFKHLQRMQVHVGYKGVPITISQKRIFDQ